MAASEVVAFGGSEILVGIGPAFARVFHSALESAVETFVLVTHLSLAVVEDWLLVSTS